MKIFFAGSQGFEKLYPALQPLLKHRLVSYHYMTNRLTEYFMTARDPNLQTEILVMDSGAFSAWSKGVTIDLEAYTKYCVENIEHISYVVNLDVIPAKPGQKSISQEEIERSAGAGWRNAQYMLRAGVPREKLIHVFHQNENFKWLERMVREFDYIGLSPANDRTTAEKMQWLDSCMPYVTDATGAPIIKFHGFAVTSHALMTRYPWFSVDSASWCQLGGRGVVSIPLLDSDGKPNYDKPAQNIRIGLNSPEEKEMKHFNSFSPRNQQQIITYLESKGHPMGVSSCQKLAEGEKKGQKPFLRFCRNRQTCDMEMPHTGCVESVLSKGVQNAYGIRAVVNAEYIVEFEALQPPWPTKLFTNNHTTQGFQL